MINIPAMIKEFSRFLPTKDNHRLNLASDLMALVAWIVFTAFFASTIKSATEVTFWQALTAGLVALAGLVAVLLFAAWCWRSTFFRGAGDQRKRPKARPKRGQAKRPPTTPLS